MWGEGHQEGGLGIRMQWEIIGVDVGQRPLGGCCWDGHRVKATRMNILGCVSGRDHWGGISWGGHDWVAALCWTWDESHWTEPLGWAQGSIGGVLLTSSLHRGLVGMDAVAVAHIGLLGTECGAGAGCGGAALCLRGARHSPPLRALHPLLAAPPAG